MTVLPEHPHLDHLRKQARDLLRRFRAGDSDAFTLIREHLPAAKNVHDDADLQAMSLQLRDAQSAIARQYGFPSWHELKHYVEWKRSGSPELRRWLRLVYAGNVTGGQGIAQPALALRVLAEHPEFAQQGDAYVACALGDEAGVRAAVAGDAAWANRAGGLLRIPPLIAVTHSSLVHDARYRDRLRRCVQLLLEAGANPNQSIGTPPHQLSALYGAAGLARDPEMTRTLLAAGANPNDGQTLYHAVGSTPCVRVLLNYGARPCSNTLANAMAHENLDAVRLLLAHGADANAPGAQRIAPLLFAIRGRRPADIVKALLDAGADPRVRTPEGQSAYGYARLAGLPQIAALLEQAGAREDLGTADAFIAACAVCDEPEARRLLAAMPNVFETLDASRLRYLPEMVWTGCDEAARLMVTLGWPITARGGDEPFFGSALNWAVFRGNAPMAEFLLRHGASWTERHGYNDNVMGTLAWSSLNQPPDFGDWVACARALVAHGMPRARRPQVADPSSAPAWVEIDGRQLEFSEDVTEALLMPDSA